jgi:hypothetical protein
MPRRERELKDSWRSRVQREVANVMVWWRRGWRLWAIEVGGQERSAMWLIALIRL